MAKGCTTNTYEEARKQRLEENKKRFQDLGISGISKNLTEITNTAKKTLRTPPRLPKLKSKDDAVAEPRRSSRVRNPVTYREDVSVADHPSLRKRSRSRPSSWESYVARPLDEIKVATEGERIRALDAAEALQMNLQTSYPSFVKSMVRSHVYSCFWLGLPSRFCEEHLPKTLYDMTLEDENGSEYEAVYIGKRSGLSGGWRAFALEHKLDDGDALVFELIEPARFKVYICRAFPDSAEDEEDTLEEEGTTRETKAKKAASNGESESNKSKKPKQAMVHETKESENQNTLKEEGKTTRATRATKRQAASNGESESNKSKTPKQSMVHETKESENQNTSKEEGKTTRATRASKRQAASNGESESNKSKTSKQSMVHETKESENQNTSTEEGKTTHATRATKRQAASNGESESNKSKKPKHAMVHETKESENQNTSKEEGKTTRATRATKRQAASNSESENSQDHLPESCIGNNVKQVKKTKSPEKEMKKKSTLPFTAESKEEAQIETVKPATSLSNKTRKSKEGVAHEIGDSGNAEQLLVENDVVNKKEIVQDADSSLKKVEPVVKASKAPRKKPAVKFFRKKV